MAGSTDSRNPQGVPAGEFSSVLTSMDALLERLANQLDAKDDAGRDAAIMARKLSDGLRDMKQKAIELPGGHLSTQRIVELQALLDRQITDRQSVLARLAEQ